MLSPFVCSDFQKDQAIALCAYVVLKQEGFFSNLILPEDTRDRTIYQGEGGVPASRPVMEGNDVLFRRFADIDVFDIELDTKDPKKIIDMVKTMEPSSGGGWRSTGSRDRHKSGLRGE
jgi:hypothetical protein